ncbi:MAG: serine hydrolase domain-containing protein [Flammeovirgaceae bacterium]
MKKLAILFIFCLLNIAASCEKEGTGSKKLLSSNPLESSTDSLVDQHIRPFMEKRQHIGMSLAVIDGNKTSYYHYGEAIKGSGKLPNLESLYEIGSITKTFTAALALDYFQQHTIDLSSAVNDFLPESVKELAKNGVKMQLKHLLNHTSGLPRLPSDITKGWNPNNPYVHYTEDDIYANLAKIELSGEPGTKMEYSNLGFALVGLILERHSGKSYEQLLTAHILKPVGLTKTKITLNAQEKSKMVAPYDPNGKEGSHWDLANFKAAGALIATIEDMATYAKVQMATYEGDKATVFKQTKKSSFVLNEQTEVGMAWFLIKKGTKTLYFHNGGTGGFSSFIMIDPVQQKAVVSISNNAFQTESETASMALFGAFNP